MEATPSTRNVSLGKRATESTYPTPSKRTRISEFSFGSHDDVAENPTLERLAENPPLERLVVDMVDCFSADVPLAFEAEPIQSST